MLKHFNLTSDEVEIFLAEVEEMLQSLDIDLILLEQAQSDNELLNRIFRAMHTLKGAAGSINHDPMARLTHAAENVLDKLRRQEIVVSTGLVDVMLAVLDVLKALQEDVPADRAPTFNVDPLIQQLNALLVLDRAEPVDAEAAQWPLLTEAGRQAVTEAIACGISVCTALITADPAGVAPSARLLQVVMALENRGQVVASLPDVDQIERGEGGHHLTVVLISEETREGLQHELESIPELLEVFVAEISDERILSAPPAAAPDPSESADEPLAPADEPAVAATPSDTGDAQKAQPARTVRASVERLDTLMNLAGELVTDRNRLQELHNHLAQIVDEEHLALFSNTVAHLSSTIDQLHEEVMKVRMQPVETVFSKFPRLVRQISQELGKQVDLVMSGQETELDRTVIEEVGDPLLHLIRNAIDHGIETPAARLAAHKPASGRLVLAARSEEGNIVITIGDDGAGINADAVREKAVRMGLLSAAEAAALGYNEAVDLIFAPGLSTAAQVSNVSGRGVGMDVVRTNIQRLNGSVTVRSRPGLGATFEIRLPLTLAVVSTLQVEACDQVFALPLHAVVETLKPERTLLATVNGQQVLRLRKSVLPLFDLNRLFGMEESSRKFDSDDVFIVSLRQGDLQFGLMVDRLVGKQDVVVKSLGYPLNNIRGLSGGTVLGNGRIGLILDVAVLAELATAGSQRRHLLAA